MNATLRRGFVLLLRLLVAVLLTPTVRYRQRLPRQGPAIVVANHNSHADTALLLSLFPLAQQPRVRPVAAADYFLDRPLLAWFATRVLGIVPLARGSGGERDDVLRECVAALACGDILIFFPEGTRGEPERMGPLRDGIGCLAKRYPVLPIVPLFTHGLGRSLPKGTLLPLPICSDLLVGRPLHWNGDHGNFLASLEAAFDHLRGQLHIPITVLKSPPTTVGDWL